jgi:hypothetical protein
MLTLRGTTAVGTGWAGPQCLIMLWWLNTRIVPHLSCWKNIMLNRYSKSTMSMAIFNSFLLVYQRVDEIWLDNAIYIYINMDYQWITIRHYILSKYMTCYARGWSSINCLVQEPWRPNSLGLCWKAQSASGYEMGNKYENYQWYRLMGHTLLCV